MTDVSLIATKFARPASMQARPGRRSFFAMLLEALYHSRRLQARRTLRQYQHLLGPAERNILRELNAGPEGPQTSGE